MHRKQGLASETVVRFNGLTDFSPARITDWTDGEPVGQTALCPDCGIDAVVGFNGPIDSTWLIAAHGRGLA